MCVCLLVCLSFPSTVCLVAPIYKGWKSNKLNTKIFPRKKLVKGNWSQILQFWLRYSLKSPCWIFFPVSNALYSAILLCIVLARRGSVAVTVGVSDMWQVTRDIWQVTGDRWQVTCDRWHVAGDTKRAKKICLASKMCNKIWRKYTQSKIFSQIGDLKSTFWVFHKILDWVFLRHYSRASQKKSIP